MTVEVEHAHGATGGKSPRRAKRWYGGWTRRMEDGRTIKFDRSLADRRRGRAWPSATISMENVSAGTVSPARCRRQPDPLLLRQRPPPIRGAAVVRVPHSRKIQHTGWAAGHCTVVRAASNLALMRRCIKAAEHRIIQIDLRDGYHPTERACTCYCAAPGEFGTVFGEFEHTFHGAPTIPIQPTVPCAPDQRTRQLRLQLIMAVRQGTSSTSWRMTCSNRFDYFNHVRRVAQQTTDTKSAPSAQIRSGSERAAP